jgi:hypothetical protein
LTTAVGPFLATTFIATLLLMQVMGIAANITGGVSLSTMDAVARATSIGRSLTKGAIGTAKGGFNFYQGVQTYNKKVKAHRESLKNAPSNTGSST